MVYEESYALKELLERTEIKNIKSIDLLDLANQFTISHNS